MERKRIAVIGAGIMGMSTGYVLKRDHPEYDVTIIAERFSPEVTSDGAPGYWYPGGTLGKTPWELQKRWSLATREWLREIHTHPDSFKNGISLCSGYIIEDHYPTVPQCKDFFPDFRLVTKEELSRFPAKAKVAFFITTYVCESSKYLPFLLKKFLALGGKTVKQKVSSFEELKDFDVIVNCTGLYSQKLCNDKELYPIRGQILRVKAPWIRHFYRFEVPSEDKYVYIFPNNDFCALGGTTNEGDYNMNVKVDDRKSIIDETAQLEPSVKNAEFVCDWVGLRPGRTQVRLERETQHLPSGGTLKIVHNYGHGRNGITMHFGCAIHTKELVEETLSEKKDSLLSIQSKL